MSTHLETKQGKKPVPKPGQPIKLNKSNVDAIAEPGVYPDTELTGFKLRVGATGAKSYQLVGKVKGESSPVYITIGKHGDPWTPDSARKEAEQKRLQMRQGINPNTLIEQKKRDAEREKEAADAQRTVKALTLKVAFEELLNKDQKESTIAVYRYVVGKHFKDWLHRPIVEITQEDVLDRYDEIRRESLSSAAHAMRILRAIFKSADVLHGHRIGELSRLNPVAILGHARKGWNAVEAREEFIHDEDLPKFYKAVQRLPNPVARDYLMVAVLTGLRLNEVCNLRWDENVDLTRKIITINSGKTRGNQSDGGKGSTAKNKQKHMLVMSDYLHRIFLERWQQRENEYVFPGKSAAGNFSDPETAINRVVDTAEIPAFTSHSLRRTFATAADALGYRLEEVQRLLNHKPGTITQRHYIQNVAERTREPMQRINDHLLKLMGADFTSSDFADKVVPLTGKTKAAR